jgi:hypothetical protein
LKSLAGESFKLSHIIKQLGRGTIFIGTVEPPKSDKQEKYTGSPIYSEEFPTENKDDGKFSIHSFFWFFKIFSKYIMFPRVSVNII